MASRPPPRPTSTSTSTSSTSVRRNLFHHHHLSRHPTTTSSSSSLPGTMPGTNPLDSSSSDDIIVKVNGKYDIQIPELPPQQEEGEDGAGDGVEELEGERDKLEKQLLEMYRNRSLQPGEPGELLVQVHSTLRRKVAGLDADNWMYEGEGEGKG